MRPSAADAAAWGAGAALLVGESGVGKTSFLRGAAAAARQREPARWVVLAEMVKHRDLLKRLPRPSELEVSHAVELVTEAAGVASSTSSAREAARTCLEAALFHSGHIDFYVDGVEEVSPFFKKKVLRLLHLLLQTRVNLVWVSSRPEVAESLRCALRCAPALLRELSPEERKQYVLGRLEKARDDSASQREEPKEPEKLEEQKESAHIVRWLSKFSLNLLSIPLYLKMLMDALCHDDQLLHKPYITLLDLYHFFVETKRDIFRERHGLKAANWENIPDEFYERHMKCAMLLLLGDMPHTDDILLTFQDYVKRNTDVLKKEKTGIFWIDENGTLRFVHFSFVEYFAALWLFEYFNNPAESNVAKLVLPSLYTKDRSTSLLRTFLDRMLVERQPSSQGEEEEEEEEEKASDANGGKINLRLHQAVLNGNDIELEKALKDGENANVTDAGGRTALHLAVWRCSSLHRLALLQQLAARCDPTRRDTLLGWTPLRYLDSVAGAKWNLLQLDVGESLLELGADSGDLQCFTSRADVAYYRQFAHLCYEWPKMSLAWLRLVPGACRYEEALVHAVRHGRKATARALLEGGWAACSGRAPESGAVRPEPPLCPRGGDHLAAEQEVVDWAIRHDYLDILSSLPEHFWDLSDVKKRHNHDFTPLHCAILAGNVKAAEKLLERGAYVKARTEDGVEPLHCAVRDYPRLNDDTRLHAVRLLLRYAADPNCMDSKGNRALIDAASTAGKEVLKVLLDKGGDIHVRDIKGRGLMHYARDADTVRYLLQRGVDPNVKDTSGAVAIHFAAKLGRLDAVEVLLPHFKEDIKDNNGITPLHLAVAQGHTTVVELLTTRLISKGKHVNITDKRGYTPLHIAVAFSNVEGLISEYDHEKQESKERLKDYSNYGEITAKDHVGVAAFLLKQGADPNLSDSEGRTPVHWAAEQGVYSIAKRLVKQRAMHVDLDAGGRAALRLALAIGHKVADLLLVNGADHTVKDYQHWGTVNYAVERSSPTILKKLLKRGADLHLPYADGRTPLHITAVQEPHALLFTLLRNKVDVDKKDAEGSTALHHAARNWDYLAVELLLSHNARTDVTDAKGRTPLELARMPFAESCDIWGDEIGRKMSEKTQSFLAEENLEGPHEPPSELIVHDLLKRIKLILFDQRYKDGRYFSNIEIAGFDTIRRRPVPTFLSMDPELVYSDYSDYSDMY